jgi:thiol-disulfide isomerase/thioredoxin
MAPTRSRPMTLLRALLPALLVTVTLAACHDDEPAPVGSCVSDTTLVLPDTDSTLVRLADYRGRVVLVVFWASWCPACRSEIPTLIALENEFAGADFEIVAVSLYGTVPEVRAFAIENGINYKVLVGGGATTAAWGIKSIPTNLFFDRNGCQVSRLVGTRDKAVFEAEIRRLTGIDAPAGTFSP